MRNEIYIGKPYLTNNGEFVRLCADLKRPAGDFTFWFEVPKEYGQYLCTERSNSFVLAILEYAMYLDCDIRCEVPLDESLHYQLVNYCNIIADNLEYRSRITINTPFDSDRIESVGGVGTGFSAGVDSFYSVLKHLNSDEHSYKLTHLVIANNGAFTLQKNDVSEKHFWNQVKYLLPASQDLGLPLISINTNSGDMMAHIHVANRYELHLFGNTPIKLASTIYALQKLFSVYYIASSFTLDEFSFGKFDTYSTLLYYAKLISTPILQFYASGSEVKRIQKVEYICNNKTVQKYLTVDLHQKDSKNIKTIRTMFELYSLNMLDQYNEVFNIQDFKAHLSDRLGWYLGSPHEQLTGFPQESIDMCKQNNVKIPMGAYVKNVCIYRPLNVLGHMLRNSKIAQKIYYAFHIDVLLLGRTQAMRNRTEKQQQSR